MAVKLEKSLYPPNHGPDSFECFGPPAVADGDFNNAYLADLGCFDQDGKDSNKYYHASVCQSTITKDWYLYLEWGRTAAGKPQYQFVKCASKEEAHREFVEQCRSKNDKRGVWVDVPGLGRRLKAKAGKDCYLVRPLSVRVTGLPNAKTIKFNDGAKVTEAKDEKETKKSKKATVKVDAQTRKLLLDLGQGTINYTRTSMADASLPTQASIDEARTILQEAMKRVAVVGNNVDDQIVDKDILEFTKYIYGRIPKKKPLGAAADTWILSANNILTWQNDLDAFESALYTSDDQEEEVDEDPYNGMKLDMSWISPTSDLGKYLYEWWPKASRNRHSHVGGMKILNMWKVNRHGDDDSFKRRQELIRDQMKGKKWNQERPLHQDRERLDLTPEQRDLWWDTNTALTFHGTRSVNVSGILRTHFRVPKDLVGVTITGAMFGAFGTYLADDWRKSDGYTSRSGAYWSSGGAVKGREAFMFACDGIMGMPHLAKGPRGYTSPPDGCHCVFGKGDHSGVANNEWVVVPNQIVQRYLIEYTTGNGRRGW